MGLTGLAIHTAATENAARILDRDLPLRLLYCHDQVHQADHQPPQHDGAANRVPGAGIELAGHELRKSGDDTGKDHDGDAVADTLLADQLRQPDDEHGAGGHGDDHGEGRQRLRAAETNAHSADEPPLALNQDKLTVPLNQSHRHGHPVCVYLYLAPPLFTLPRQRLQGGHQRHHKLHDDGRRDVGVDAHSGHAHVLKGAAAENVQKPEDSAALEDGGQLLGVSPRHRQVRHEAKYDEHGKGEDQLLADVRLEQRVVYRREQLGTWPWLRSSRRRHHRSPGLCRPPPQSSPSRT